MEDAEQFLSFKKFDSNNEIIRSVKVLGIFYDTEEMDEEIKEFSSAAHQMAGSPNICFAELLSRDEIKKARKKYQDEWFEDYSHSTVIIQKVPGHFTKIDLSEYRKYTLREMLKL